MDKARLRQRAKCLRTNSTDAELHLWYNLRAKRLGVKFKRQVPLGQYIVDFLCHEKHLIIEIDGSQHLNNQLYDQNRSHWLHAQGFKVIRFWNHDVLQQTSAVLEAILQALNASHQIPLKTINLINYNRLAIVGSCSTSGLSAIGDNSSGSTEEL